ncbi:MAG: hypothetical protein JJE17_10170 [Peptostreptococcaceae bacterium]|nr:hypothetical protein [Peptostreptococcaceae bacterium]
MPSLPIIFCTEKRPVLYLEFPTNYIKAGGSKTVEFKEMLTDLDMEVIKVITNNPSIV